jgi:hypothetical protein
MCLSEKSPRPMKGTTSPGRSVIVYGQGSPSRGRIANSRTTFNVVESGHPAIQSR